jgi:hypothetical protein
MESTAKVEGWIAPTCHNMMWGQTSGGLGAHSSEREPKGKGKEGEEKKKIRAKQEKRKRKKERGSHQLELSPPAGPPMACAIAGAI